jgi:hypothetical protein
MTVCDPKLTGNTVVPWSVPQIINHYMPNILKLIWFGAYCFVIIEICDISSDKTMNNTFDNSIKQHGKGD